MIKLVKILKLPLSFSMKKVRNKCGSPMLLMIDLMFCLNLIFSLFNSLMITSSLRSTRPVAPSSPGSLDEYPSPSYWAKEACGCYWPRSWSPRDYWGAACCWTTPPTADLLVLTVVDGRKACADDTPPDAPPAPGWPISAPPADWSRMFVPSAKLPLFYELETSSCL